MDGGLDGLVGAVGKKYYLVKCGCAVGVHGAYVVITVFIICWFSWFMKKSVCLERDFD